MNILIIGSGAREHALGKEIVDEGRKIYFAPGNGGTSDIGENVDIKVDQIDKLYHKNIESKSINSLCLSIF